MRAGRVRAGDGSSACWRKKGVSDLVFSLVTGKKTSRFLKAGLSMSFLCVVLMQTTLKEKPSERCTNKGQKNPTNKQPNREQKPHKVGDGAGPQKDDVSSSTEI